MDPKKRGKGKKPQRVWSMGMEGEGSVAWKLDGVEGGTGTGTGPQHCRISWEPFHRQAFCSSGLKQ